ncbi:MAG TPA: ATP-binding cassette domain-containing protein [Longimicrobium sp.]|jgi:ABC-2 type transport system ATP-binding protein
MISIEKLTVRYGSTPVLNGVDLVVDGGQVHGLAGRNGAGKTTLLDALYGFVRPSGGVIRFRGEPLRSREVVGYLPAPSFFYPKITGREYLGVFRAGRAGFDVAEWNRVFDLPLDRLVETYSLGMRKKLALLGVLSLGRPVLILDEPFNGLDLETNQILTRLFRELADAGHTVLLTSHILASLTTGCDAVHLLSAGRIERTFRAGEFDGIEALLLDGEVGGKLELVRRLVDRGG